MSEKYPILQSHSGDFYRFSEQKIQSLVDVKQPKHFLSQTTQLLFTKVKPNLHLVHLDSEVMHV